MLRSSTVRRCLATVAVAASLASAACTGSRPELVDEERTTTTEPSTTTTEPAPIAEVAEATGDAIDIFADATTETPVRRLTAAEATAAPNIPIVFLVKSKTEDRLEVYLPVPPAGSTGWVRIKDVSRAADPFRIEVSLADHRLRVYDRDDMVLDEPVAIGTTDRPAPGGTYYLKELLQPPDGGGPYGVYAYGISGFTTALTSFNAGQGLIGIHGTNDPSVMGQDVPLGSIRLPNESITRLVTEIGLPLGTPVEILP